MRSGSAALRRCCVRLRARELTQFRDGVQTGKCQCRVCSCYAACIALHSRSWLQGVGSELLPVRGAQGPAILNRYSVELYSHGCLKIGLTSCVSAVYRTMQLSPGHGLPCLLQQQHFVLHSLLYHSVSPNSRSGLLHNSYRVR